VAAPWQDGRCKTLDASADGYMRGEAALVHLVEAFTGNELAACHLAGGALVLAGTAVNQDGRSSSLTVSNKLLRTCNKP
jgi:acyl transferase domain-containing protein